MSYEVQMVTHINPVLVLPPVRPDIKYKDIFCFNGILNESAAEIIETAQSIPGCFVYYSFMDMCGNIFLTKNKHADSEGYYIMDQEIEMRAKRDIYEILQDVCVRKDLSELYERYPQFNSIYNLCLQSR